MDPPYLYGLSVVPLISMVTVVPLISMVTIVPLIFMVTSHHYILDIVVFQMSYLKYNGG